MKTMDRKRYCYSHEMGDSIDCDSHHYYNFSGGMEDVDRRNSSGRTKMDGVSHGMTVGGMTSCRDDCWSRNWMMSTRFDGCCSDVHSRFLFRCGVLYVRGMSVTAIWNH